MNYKKENISLVRANVNSQSFDGGTIDFVRSYPYANLFYPFIWDYSGNYRNISLTIDVLNKYTKDNKFPNEKWIDDDRIRNNLVNDVKWGFKETNNLVIDSPAISNAICFTGQVLSFYIAADGNDTGYINNTYCYCKTILTISITDIILGNNTQIYSFSNFSSCKKDSSRYFQWVVPDNNYNVFTNYGTYGMFVIRLDISKQFFKDAQMTKSLLNNCSKSQALLQLLTYSAASELENVYPDRVRITTGYIPTTATYNQMFNTTVFNSLNSLNLLTDDQKRCIITDQAAFLFMSQHPVVVADCYPSKIVGFGSQPIIRPDLTDSIAPLNNEPIEIVPDRLYGLASACNIFNYVDDIQSNFTNFNQSQQLVRDPQRSVIVDENGILDQSYGVNGIQFNPYVVELNNADLLYGEPFIFDLVLSPNIAEIGNIKITEDNGNLFTIDNYPYYQSTGNIKLSFDIINGSNNISKVQYSLWSKNNLEHYEYIDRTGTSTSHVFSVRRVDGIPLGVEYSNSLADTVYARIDIFDSNCNSSSFYCEKLLPEPVFDSNTNPGITSISVLQRQDGSGLVDISYDYFGRSTINSSNVSATVSNGSFFIPLNTSNARGDFGLGIMPGRNNIIWNPAYDINTYPITVSVMLTLTDADNNSNIGTNSAMCIVNLNSPDVTIRKLSQEEEYPQGVTLGYRIILMDEFANSNLYYLVNGLISESLDISDVVSTDFKVAILDEYGNTSYHYIVDGVFSSEKEYINNITSHYKFGVLDEFMNTSYYNLYNGVVSK